MSQLLERTMELQKFVLDNLGDPDVVIARLAKAEREAFTWFALKHAGGMSQQTIDEVERVTEVLWAGGLRRPA